MEEVDGEQRADGVVPGFYTFVRHLGKMGPPSSLLFLTAFRRKRRNKEGRKHIRGMKIEEEEKERKDS